jgi:hypothetical protein
MLWFQDQIPPIIPANTHTQGHSQHKDIAPLLWKAHNVTIQGATMITFTKKRHELLAAHFTLRES